MPRRCCVTGCKSNYDSQNRYVSVFKFPKDPNLKIKWVASIPRKNWTPSQNSVVCSLHFQECEVIRYDEFTRKDGTIGKNLLKFPKLKENSVPSIFPNLPTYLSKPSVPPRKNPEERRQNHINHQNQIIAEFEAQDIIQNFNQLLNDYSNKLDIANWIVYKTENKLYFYQLTVQENQESLVFKSQILIDEKMVVQVFLGRNKLCFNDLRWILPFDMKLNRWSQLENILSRYKENLEGKAAENSVESFNNLLEIILKHLDQALTVSCENNFPYSKNIEILIDQLRQINSKKNRYSSSTIIMSFMIHTTSHSTYELLRGFFILPHRRYLQRISSELNVSPSNDINNNNYISNMSSTLTPREKVVVLLIDEIYIAPRLEYRSKNLIGYAANKDSLAKTILAFMISSAFGNFHEIVKLVPVNSISGVEIIPFATSVIELVQKCGFEIICIVTDNCRINQTMFKKLSNTNCIPNPLGNGKTIFLSYDFVHVMKNIRNNWFNLKNLDKTFVYPDFETGLIKYAKFSDLKKVYEAEKHSFIKKAYKLNFKTLFPNNFERQKVSLVDNLFHDSTIAALKDFGFNDTADFLQLIRNWWDVVNNTSVIKGVIRRNEFSKPISGIDDYRVQYLEKFVSWINKWHDLDSNGHLTNDTHKAFFQCTSTLLDIVKYSFAVYNIEYFLPGKFTTEKLEKRFGNYRLLSGCNYNVSLDEVLNAEKKIRVKRIFKSTGSTFSLDDIKKKFFFENNDSSTFTFDEDTSNIDEFTDVLNSDYLIDCAVDESAKIYIAGYGSHSAFKKLNCSICLSLIVEEKGFLIYADDLKIFLRIRSIEDAALLQKDLDRFCQYCRDNFLFLSLNKCQHEILQTGQIVGEKKKERIGAIEKMLLGSLPSDWLFATVTPIYKKGDKLSPDNYRPISLLSAVAKVMERIISEKLLEFSLSNGLISDEQHGFVPGRSTTTNLLSCISDWTKAMDSGQPTDVIYLDFSKAFDRVPHNRLLANLEHIGVRGELLVWIKAFLTGRSYRVRVGSSFSSSAWPVLSGVPQGSVLGPLLFLLCASDLPFRFKSTLSQFADDIKLYNNPIVNHADLQTDLNILNKWCEEWLLPLNTSKCFVLHIGKNNPRLGYTINAEYLTPVSQIEDLGVTISEDLRAVMTELSGLFSRHTSDQHLSTLVQFGGAPRRPPAIFLSPHSDGPLALIMVQCDPHTNSDFLP
ncbi:uncharacterized protein LOC123322410 [Coccinella septempunctata]|uniref:uncharacterized protein LOC123322410 n=1 Tax=Coccinella septempunctata TaxID=41139 RepID=UPI001D095C20|nr:uncharacterized protein LOC123322410 [Coccinella septempunctata]